MALNAPVPAQPYIGAHLILIRDGQILLLKRETGNLHGKYMFPAGKVDAGETPSQALAREALEEVGVTVLANDLKPVCVVYRTDTLYNDKPIDIVEFFMITDHWDGEPTNCEPDVCSEVGFYPLDALPENLSPSVKHLVANLDYNLIEVSNENWDDYSAKSFLSSRGGILTKSM